MIYRPYRDPTETVFTGIKIGVCNQKLNFLFLNQNICCWHSKEPSQWDDSFKHPKPMLQLMNKKILTFLHLIFFHVDLWFTKLGMSLYTNQNILSSTIIFSLKLGNVGGFTSNIIPQTFLIHCVTASAVPDIVTARSVDAGNISLATWIDAPVLWKGKVANALRVAKTP